MSFDALSLWMYNVAVEKETKDVLYVVGVLNIKCLIKYCWFFTFATHAMAHKKYVCVCVCVVFFRSFLCHLRRFCLMFTLRESKILIFNQGDDIFYCCKNIRKFTSTPRGNLACAGATFIFSPQFINLKWKTFSVIALIKVFFITNYSIIFHYIEHIKLASGNKFSLCNKSI